MDQGGGLEGLAGLFLGQFLGRQLAQFILDQQQELLRGVQVATLNGELNARHVAHG